MNLYSYAQNNPIDFTDPSGLNRQASGSGGGQRGMLYTLYYGNNNDGWTALFSWFVPYGDGGDGEESSGGGNNDKNTGPKATYSEERLNYCLGLFGIKLTESIDVERFLNKISVTANYHFESPEGTIDATFNVETFLQSKDSRELAGMYNATNPGANYISQSGLTLYDNPARNFIATDVSVNDKKYTLVGFQALFVHELGNSLYAQLYKHLKETLGATNEMRHPFEGFGDLNKPIDDSDFGQLLESCVFGGRVGLQTGRLGTSREL